jgi:hypothetical protein
MAFSMAKLQTGDLVLDKLDIYQDMKFIEAQKHIRRTTIDSYLLVKREPGQKLRPDRAGAPPCQKIRALILSPQKAMIGAGASDCGAQSLAVGHVKEYYGLIMCNSTFKLLVFHSDQMQPSVRRPDELDAYYAEMASGQYFIRATCGSCMHIWLYM